MMPLYSQTMSELENLGTRPTGEHVSHPQCGFMNVIRKVKEARRKDQGSSESTAKAGQEKACSSTGRWSTISIDHVAGHIIPLCTGQGQSGALTPWQSWNDASSAVSVREASNNAIWLFGVGERGFGCKSGHVHERLLMDRIFKRPFL